MTAISNQNSLNALRKSSVPGQEHIIVDEQTGNFTLIDKPKPTWYGRIVKFINYIAFKLNLGNKVNTKKNELQSIINKIVESPKVRELLDATQEDEVMQDEVIQCIDKLADRLGKPWGLHIPAFPSLLKRS